MHVHQLPMLPERIQQQPAPKPEDAARARAAFEQMTALAVGERSQKDRKQPRGEKPQQVNAEKKQSVAQSTQSAPRLARPANDGVIDILV